MAVRWWRRSLTPRTSWANARSAESCVCAKSASSSWAGTASAARCGYGQVSLITNSIRRWNWLKNYAKRWEHEVAYRELKLDVRSAVLLISHTLETALQEVMAVVLAMAAITRVRMAAGERLGVPTLRVSFLKVLQLNQQLWQSFAWAQSQYSPALAATLYQHYFESVQRRALLPQRRARSCPRVRRQPVSLGPEKPTTSPFPAPSTSASSTCLNGIALKMGRVSTPQSAAVRQPGHRIATPGPQDRAARTATRQCQSPSL